MHLFVCVVLYIQKLMKKQNEKKVLAESAPIFALIFGEIHVFLCENIQLVSI